MTLNTQHEMVEAVQTLKQMLSAQATGGTVVGNYIDLRQRLVKHPLIGSQLPSWVRSCRTLDEFWGFIQPKFGTYRERRKFLQEAFEPLLSNLEGGQSQADGEIAKGLSQNASENIQALWQKALTRRIDDPEGAITTARTLLESVCKHLLDDLGESYDDTCDLPQIYKLLAAKMRLGPNQHTEQIFKQILGGCQSVVEGLGAMRNRLSDAHGKGRSGVKPQPRHAQLAVNLAGSVALFLVETNRVRLTPPPVEALASKK